MQPTAVLSVLHSASAQSFQLPATAWHGIVWYGVLSRSLSQLLLLFSFSLFAVVVSSLQYIFAVSETEVSVFPRQVILSYPLPRDMAAAAALFTALVTLFATATAQTEQVTWAAVVFTYHGEKVPDLSSGPYYLTPYGANQLLNAGQIVRETYISPPKNGSSSAVINGISPNAIDNSQLYVLGTDDTVISQSMQAFIQGLYPPRGGITFDQQDEMSDSSLEQ